MEIKALSQQKIISFCDIKILGSDISKRIISEDIKLHFKELHEWYVFCCILNLSSYLSIISSFMYVYIYIHFSLDYGISHVNNDGYKVHELLSSLSYTLGALLNQQQRQQQHSDTDYSSDKNKDSHTTTSCNSNTSQAIHNNRILPGLIQQCALIDQVYSAHISSLSNTSSIKSDYDSSKVRAFMGLLTMFKGYYYFN